MKKAVRFLFTTLFIASFFLFSALGQPLQPSVMLDGKMINFTQPVKNVNGRIMVPFRTLLEQAGAAVGFDPETGLISAVYEDKTLSFRAGSGTITINTPEGEETLFADVPSFIDPETNSTYVGARFLSASLGFDVGWDAANNTVVIIDTERLFDIDSDFSLLNRILKSQRLQGEASYLLNNASLSYSYDPADKTKSAPLSYDAQISGCWKGDAMQMSVIMELDYQSMYALLPEEDYQNKVQAFERHGPIAIDYRFDPEGGKVYYKNALLDIDPFLLSTGTRIGGDSWISYTLNNQKYSYFLGLDQFFHKKKIDKMILSDLFHLTNDPSSYTVATYDETRSNILLMKALLGDGAFTAGEDAETGGARYSRSIDTDDFAAAIDGLLAGLKQEGLIDSAAAKKLSRTKDSGSAITGSFALTEKEGQVTSSSLTLRISLPSADTGVSTETTYICSLDAHGALSYILTTLQKDESQTLSQTAKADFYKTNLSPDVTSQKKEGAYIWENIVSLIKR